jgi:hypothetical protein
MTGFWMVRGMTLTVGTTHGVAGGLGVTLGGHSEK